MKYTHIEPHPSLANYIDAFWTVEGIDRLGTCTKIMPDGCVDLIFNIGDDCRAENGELTMESGKTYMVGTMTTFKESFLNTSNRLVGVRFKPSAFSSFYNYTSMDKLTNQLVEFDRLLAPDIHRVQQYSVAYLQTYFLDRMKEPKHNLFKAIEGIQMADGHISIDTLAAVNHTTRRQLERDFKKHIGISPKEYVNIIRFKTALKKVKQNKGRHNMSAIAYECGYYDHAHLTNEIKRYTGLAPSQI